MWRDVEYNEKPSLVDSDSSSMYVYVRKDIQKINRTTDTGVTETLYTCKEQLILKSDWEMYKNIISSQDAIKDMQDALIELASIIGEA